MTRACLRAASLVAPGWCSCFFNDNVLLKFTASFMSAFVPVALGVGNGVIPNNAMRASSVLDRYHVPSQARLNNTRQGKNAGAWKPKVSDKKQYLEVDLGALTKVTQVCVIIYLVFRI